MAAPTIQYQDSSPGAGNHSVENVMTGLHALLVAAGWSIEYADSDAIGSGSAGSPAWDKAPTANTVAGVAVYQMPANGFSIEWFVKLIARWGGATARVGFGVQTGKTHDGSGTVTDGSTELGSSIYSTNNEDAGWIANASEDGFAFTTYGVTYQGCRIALVERVRDYQGDTREATATLVGYGTSVTQTVLREDSPIPWCSSTNAYGIAAFSSTTAGAVSNVNVGTGDLDGDIAFPIAPFFPTQYGMSGFARHLLFFDARDAGQNVLIPVAVDGGIKNYATPNAAITQTITNSSHWITLATE